MKTCPNCKTAKNKSEFYNRRNKEGSTPYCKICSNAQSILRQQKLKSEAVEYKGGKCISCDYKTYQGALEFHHLDPNEKDFNIGQVKCRSLNAIKSELDKCILLCANCHREIHAGLMEYKDGNIIKSVPETLEWNLSVSDKHLKIRKDLELIIQRYTNKETTKDIAKDYNVTSTYLLKLLNEAGIKVSDIPEQHAVRYPIKGKYPSDEELTRLVWLKTSEELSKEIGVSGVALGKHCKKRGIEKPPRGYWAKQAAL